MSLSSWWAPRRT
ncbi:hypothetical protein LEMLEM_LOCUS2304 [Lemmus lemmus]